MLWKSFKLIILSSSGVERSAVNRFVVGSNPTWGDILRHLKFVVAPSLQTKFNNNLRGTNP